MNLPNDSRLVTQRIENRRGGLNMVMSLEVVPAVVQAILAILVGVKTAVDGGAAATARGSASEGFGETRSLRGESVDVGGLNGGEAVAMKHETEVVCYDLHDILVRVGVE